MLLRITLLVAMALSIELQANTDVHVHTSSRGQFGASIPNILSSMAQHKIDRSFLLSAGYTHGFVLKTQSVEEENDFIAKQVALHPDKFIGVCSVPYPYGKALEEIKRCAQVLHLKGLKLHPIEDYVRVGKHVPNFNDPADFKILTDILKTAAENSMFVLMHSWYLTNQEIFYVLGDAARRYPNLKLVLFHGMAANYESLADLILLRNHFKNVRFPQVYLEISFAWNRFPKESPRRDDWIRHLRWFGVENILFGSDTSKSDKDLSEALQEYREIFTEQEMHQIMNQNADRLLSH